MPEDKGLSRSQREEKVLQFWKDNQIFKKTLEKPSDKGEFVFYEGPPTANGKPGIHHVEARAFKDAIPRYKTMQGFHVRRKAGWDTHGLPVELEVEKKLGLKSKKEIEEYGVEKFNDECKKSVWTYVDLWRQFSDRMGYWADYENAYVTYKNPYIESIWTILAEVEKQKLLYKDYKVVPWCPRCGTGLSSHELAQGYKDVKDISLYVKFKIIGHDNAYFLAWTTTPWTLPGNIALAVGPEIDYVVLEKPDEGTGPLVRFILAKDRVEKIFGTEGYEIIETKKGKDLVGLEYEPLYPFVKNITSDIQGPALDKAFKVHTADFVITTDGTGIVHTAVMYGQEDFDLGNEVGLPKVHLVSPEGLFIKGTDWLEGKSVVDETLAVDILKELQGRGLLFEKENYTHSYPFCWRCNTRLIYYARDSWYVRMSEVRDRLVLENQNINWEPDYIKEGRFGEWLREVKDWAISRERYWGTPLPIWQTEDQKERIVVDSLDTIRKYIKKSGNKYFVMRHGGTEGNKKEIVSFKNQESDHITEEGKKQAEKSAEDLRGKKIDLIISSPFTRTKETAEVVGKVLGVEVVSDERIIEINPGKYDGGDWNEYHETMYAAGPDWFNVTMPGGESLSDVRKRMGEFLYDLENKYKDKNILIVTHGGPAWLLYVVSGLHLPDNKKYSISKDKDFVNDFERFKNAEVRPLDFVPLPHDKNFALDLHKPFIDEVVLEKEGKEYKRVKEVMDVWFDSGSMPFSQDSDDRERAGDYSNIMYPADFISEALDQTRGWFYTMHAIGVLMGRGTAFKNVICLGLLLDKDGKKMSKTTGNVVDPMEAMEKHGADAVRFWMYSINQPGDAKNYDDKTVDEVNKRVFNMLDNIYSFYDLFRDKELETKELKLANVSHILDRWILIRLSELTNIMTVKLDSYNLIEPTRAFREFVDDLSTWYLRRSRERIKDGDVEAKQTLYTVLKTISKLLAPFAPFISEELYQKLRTEDDPESVHLEEWPKTIQGRALDSENVLSSMNEVRKIVTLALEARSKANIKVRQPLSELRIKNGELGKEFLDLIQDELNVKKVVQDKNLETEIDLDINITDELAEEGRVREIIRSIQEMRKEKNLNPKDKMKYEVKEDEALFKKYQPEIEKATNIEIVF
ncbi:MAG: class I tRNA ligase family protein [Minisyncoccota bacterium]